MPEEKIILELREQITVLRDVLKHYSGRTIDNIIQNLESILDFYIKKQKENGTERIPTASNDNMLADE